MKYLTFILVVFCTGNFGYSQVRPIEEAQPTSAPVEKAKSEPTSVSNENEDIEEDTEADTTRGLSAEELAKLPKEFKVRYEGGLFGFSKKMKGTLKFDEINKRVIFYGEDGKEKFSLPNSSIIAVSPNQTKVQSGTGKVIGAAPVIGAGLLGSMIKKKKNYLLVQFSDPDVNASGIMNFLMESEPAQKSAVEAIGRRLGLRQRGDAYIRGKDY
ncbi:MAG: hypothetical protein ACK5NT_13240 [Pyrinomonadaceae bacterium]